jgi:shikimate dehydrogenase
LIGRHLGHSFSKNYFEEKWRTAQITNCSYELIEIPFIQHIREILDSENDYSGLNITIPYKEQIIPFLEGFTAIAEQTGSVNCLKKINGKWTGHNTDAEAFEVSLLHFLPDNFDGECLILGTGGASRSVQYILKKRRLDFTLVSTSGKGWNYDSLKTNWNKNWKLIINTTPLGMYPLTSSKPSLPYELINENNYLYDLIYNPEKTLFLNLGALQGAQIKNGLEMLHLQADKSWQFWNE